MRQSRENPEKPERHYGTFRLSCIMFAVGWLAVNLIMARSVVEPYSASNPGKKSSSLEGGSEGARREG